MSTFPIDVQDMEIKFIEELMVTSKIICGIEDVDYITKICENRRGTQVKMDFLTADKVLIE